MSRPLIILGTGGNAFDVLDIVDALADRGDVWEVRGFLDDAPPAGSHYLGYPVLGGLRDAGRFPDGWFISTIRNEGVFRRAADILAGTGIPADRFATLVHPQAEVSRRAALGRGVYVNFGASVAGGVVIGDQASLGPGCAVGHNAAIGDHTMLAPHVVVSGSVAVGRLCYLGAGAVVRQHVRVGDGALVGMGAVVVKDVPPGVTVVGNPARRLERAGG